MPARTSSQQARQTLPAREHAAIVAADTGWSRFAKATIYTTEYHILGSPMPTHCRRVSRTDFLPRSRAPGGTRPGRA